MLSWPVSVYLTPCLPPTPDPLPTPSPRPRPLAACYSLYVIEIAMHAAGALFCINCDAIFARIDCGAICVYQLWRHLCAYQRWRHLPALVSMPVSMIDVVGDSFSHYVPPFCEVRFS